jgi:DnaJ-class molecular chaperone
MIESAMEKYGKITFQCRMPIMTKKKQKKTCDICGGSGQISFFKGVSRFLLTTEECAECAGTGFQLSLNVKRTETNRDKKKKDEK